MGHERRDNGFDLRSGGKHHQRGLQYRSRENPAGIATWHWTYGSFAAARKIYLADLFVRPEFRGRQYGKALIANLAKRVLAHGGAGIGWEVLDWNKPSIDFYDGLGATSIKNWIAYNLSGEALTRLALS